MRHENIVRVLAFCTDDPERPLCLVMERMEESLYDYVGESGISPPPTIRLALVKDVCQVIGGSCACIIEKIGRSSVCNFCNTTMLPRLIKL